jgi:hypothetical protein
VHGAECTHHGAIDNSSAVVRAPSITVRALSSPVDRPRSTLVRERQRCLAVAWCETHAQSVIARRRTGRSKRFEQLNVIHSMHDGAERIAMTRERGHVEPHARVSRRPACASATVRAAEPLHAARRFSSGSADDETQKSVGRAAMRMTPARTTAVRLDGASFGWRTGHTGSAVRPQGPDESLPEKKWLGLAAFRAEGWLEWESSRLVLLPKLPSLG